jgi:hypothetical protein
VPKRMKPSGPHPPRRDGCTSASRPDPSPPCCCCCSGSPSLSGLDAAEKYSTSIWRNAPVSVDDAVPDDSEELGAPAASIFSTEVMGPWSPWACARWDARGDVEDTSASRSKRAQQ